MKRPLIGLTPYTKNDDGSRYFPQGYLDGIERAGGEPKKIDYVNFPMDAVDALAEELDAMLFSGGRDVDPMLYGEEDWPEAGAHLPDRDALEIALLKAMVARRKPILGICRGLQIVNVALGGSLHQDIPRVFHTVHEQGKSEAPFWHEIDIVPGTRTSRIFGTDVLGTDSYHHQCANRVAEGMIVSARARDGVIEALEYPGEQFLLLLQWHPEKTLDQDEYSMKPFHALLEAVASARRAF